MARKRKKKKGKLGIILLIFFILVLMVLSAAGAFAYYANKVIEENAIKDIHPDDIYSLIYQKTTIYDGEGKELDAL